MILLWFILGLMIILGIARYNESNKLFWVLFFSYIMGFAGAKMVIDLNHKNERSDVNLTQVLPTQETIATCNSIELFTHITDLLSTKVTASNPVSQVYTPVLNEINVTLSQVSERTRDQPLLTLLKPPEL